MNFMALEYWTDGWRECSLMPNGAGLRRCTCGQFVLMKELVEIGSAEASDLPRIDKVPDDLLPECIEQTDREDLEVAARLEYWRCLNHPYRERYRLHRDAEEDSTKAAWETANPDRRTRWDKFRGLKTPTYRRLPGSPFTYPAFEATDEQLQNMKRLSEILLGWVKASRRGYILELSELYREQGRFAEAEQVIVALNNNEVGITSRLITDLVKAKKPAPMRYMM